MVRGADIRIGDAAYEKVLLLASAWSVPVGEVVTRLLDEFARRTGGQAVSQSPPQHRGVAIHAIYERVRTDGLYEPGTGNVLITSGPLNGTSFKTPSGAATAIVHSINPTVRPNRNGWGFFVVSETGGLLQTLRRSTLKA